MAADRSQLERGTICLAIYPFTQGFPLTVVVSQVEDQIRENLETFKDIESFQAIVERGDIPEVVTKVKLRRVLLLQTATNERMSDVVVAKISSIKDSHRERKSFYGKLCSGTHPTMIRVGDKREHGLNESEGYINLTSVSTIATNSIHRCVGFLDDEEMRAVSRRLVSSLEIDVSGLT